MENKSIFHAMTFAALPPITPVTPVATLTSLPPEYAQGAAKPPLARVMLDCALMVTSGQALDGDSPQIMLAVAPRTGRHPISSLVTDKNSAIAWKSFDGTEESIVFERTPEHPSDHALVVREIFADGLLVAEFPLENVKTFGSDKALAPGEFGVDGLSDPETSAVDTALSHSSEPFFWVLGPAGNNP